MAAGPPFVLDVLLGGEDQILERVIKIASATRLPEVLAEAVFFITNLAVYCTKSQFHQRLLNREIIIILIRVL